MRMTMNKYKIYLMALSVLTVFSSCAFLPNPDKFVLDKRTNTPIECRILSATDSVSQINDSEILISDGGICAMKRDDLTQSHFLCNINVSSGKGIRFYFRSDPTKYLQDGGIVYEFNERGSFIFENGGHVQSIDSVRLQRNYPILLQLKQDGSKYLILADCDTVYQGTTKITATEYVIIKPIGSNVKISAVHFDHIFETDKYNRQVKADREQLLEKLRNN